MRWLTFTRSSAQEAAGAGMQVLEQFTAVYAQLGEPPEVAMFCRQGPSDDHVTYWLTPATDAHAPVLARLFDARPGHAPPANASLLAGVTGKRPTDFK